MSCSPPHARAERRQRHVRSVLLVLAMLAAALACAPGRGAWVQAPTSQSRRDLLRLLPGLASAVATPSASWAAGFAPSDLGMAGAGGLEAQVKRAEDPKKLEEAIYLISRVQEASVQQERLVTTGKFKDVQRNSITMALNMMLDNYRLSDQVVLASGYVQPTSNIVKASQAGNEAIDVLETAKEYFGTPLKVSGLSDQQRQFIIDAMQAVRKKLDTFLTYLPEDVIRAARKRVEDENEANQKEFVAQDGMAAMSNPVTLPWKK
eukprot:gb/GFBE01017359.1/.p1 GENE.gb/GFBE01017359.1/~~gb/GFBE01017359.1/.p1  ORF type:complete len:263 (+),score=61.42 gb/GFBE01017359.1/:1-789(+)